MVNFNVVLGANWTVNFCCPILGAYGGCFTSLIVLCNILFILYIYMLMLLEIMYFIMSSAVGVDDFNGNIEMKSQSKRKSCI